jgi:hypothetical protein
LATEIHATAIGEANVQDGHVNVGDVEDQRLVQRAGLGDDFQVALGLEEFSQASTHDFVVINEEQSDHLSPSGWRSIEP